MADNYQKVNGDLLYTRGDSHNGVSVTGMGYRGTWRSTDQAPRRAIDSGLIEAAGYGSYTTGISVLEYEGQICD